MSIRKIQAVNTSIIILFVISCVCRFNKWCLLFTKLSDVFKIIAKALYNTDDLQYLTLALFIVSNCMG